MPRTRAPGRQGPKRSRHRGFDAIQRSCAEDHLHSGRAQVALVRLTKEPRDAWPHCRGAGETVDTVDREAIYEELGRVRSTFRRLVEDASPADLARRSDGTRWTNQQLLFHMLFGYLLMRPLIVLARVFARLPATASQAFARVLDAGTGPFHRINYLGSCAGAKVFPTRRLAGKMDQVTGALEQRLRAG